MRAGCLALAAAALGALSAPAVAESPLTAVEWSTLPDYCKAAMLKSAYRHIVPSSNRLTPTWAFSVPNTYGVPGAHHFCMGMVLLDRAKKRQASYREALNELTYSHVEMDSSQPGYPYVAHYVATAHYRSGDRVRAYNLWQDCIEAQPQSRYCYLSMADALLTDKRPKEALDLLLKYDEAKEAEYPDAEHFIARALYENKRYPEALARAERAAELGYPLSGLRDKLRTIVAGNGGAGKR